MNKRGVDEGNEGQFDSLRDTVIEYEDYSFQLLLFYLDHESWDDPVEY